MLRVWSVLVGSLLWLDIVFSGLWLGRRLTCELTDIYLFFLDL